MVRRKIALILGGGGARSFAHLGIYDVLKENNINIDLIVSSSMGSLIGVAIASKIPSELIKKEFYKLVTRINWGRINISNKGFFSQRNIIFLLHKLINYKNIEDLPIKTIIIATDLIEAKMVTFTKGDIVKAVRASSAFPGIYSPIKIGNMLLSDGGIINSIPSDIGRKNVGKEGIVISSILDNNRRAPLKDLKNTFQIIWRSIYIPLVISREKNVRENSDVIFKPLNSEALTFKNWKDVLKFHNPRIMESFYNKGRVEAKKHISKIKRLIKDESYSISSSI
jgi:NTE family protein